MTSKFGGSTVCRIQQLLRPVSIYTRKDTVMLPSRLRCWWFALLTIESSKAIYSSAESHHDYVLSRGLLEKWRTKTKNGVTLFDRLPRNVERSYTPVSFSKEFLDGFLFIGFYYLLGKPV